MLKGSGMTNMADSNLGNLASDSFGGTILAFIALGVCALVIYLFVKSSDLLSRGAMKAANKDYRDPNNYSLFRWIFWPIMIGLLLLVANYGK
jgi:hypothetical protein